MKLEQRLDKHTQAIFDEMFPDEELTIILRVALEKGYGPTLLPLLKEIYMSDAFNIPNVVVEAIQVLAHAQCENQYCAVFHAVNLIDLGFSEQELLEFVNTQQLPERFGDLGGFRNSLRLIAAQFNSPALAKQLNSQLKKLHTDSEMADLGTLLAFCHLDRFILEFFSDEIDVDSEPMITERPSFTESIKVTLGKFQDIESPIVTLCSVCKSVKTEEQEHWIPIETAIPQIPITALFSHGYCPTCLNQTLEDEGLN